MRKRYTILGTILFIMIICAGLQWFIFLKDTNPIPKSMRKDVKFTLYYPDEDKLPNNYTLDKASFKKQEGAIIYKITNKKTDFYVSLQKKPSDSEMQTFYGTRLPLRNNITTPIGQAAVGILNNQTFVSIPTTENTWIIVASKLNTDQGSLQQIVKSLRK